ncbi:IMPACT family protein [Wohlfahrtiimonas larvae]|uniref:YigZ family protein n=1 Tax=Wohlfahrtiimonas larvae TaxID=1157986 RepID=A0ABP9MSS0_9GAMM|nr:YigZ family protein [Wohlfahrtiimonas larvae]
MAEIYKEIQTEANSEFTEQKSKFLGFAFPVYDEQEIKNIITRLRAEHPNANHVCYAYRLGERYDLYRFSDDGEPGGTAGRPIFGQIEAFGLTNILVASVRYFGGIKLGTGGLVSNYQKSAKVTLESAQIIEKHIMETVTFLYDYDVTNDVQKLIHDFCIVDVTTEYLEQCHCTVRLDIDRIEEFKNAISQNHRLVLVK